MDPAGFFTKLPSSLLHEVKAATWLAIDVKTTATTRSSPASRIRSGTRIGEGTWIKYRAENPNVSVSTAPRIRVLSVYTESLGVCSWDLDALTPEERRRLLDAVLADKIFVAHNAGVILSWLFAETFARPKFVLDSMLLIRHIRPGLLLRPFRLAVGGTDVMQKRSKEMITEENGKPTVSINYIATAMQLPEPEMIFQPMPNWCVKPLSARHLDHVTRNIDAPLKILKFLMPKSSVDQMPSLIQELFPWYVPFGIALVRLAEAHVRGVPFDREGAEKLRAECMSEISIAAKDLAAIPAFEDSLKDLSDPNLGETREIKQALDTHATARGISLLRTGNGILLSSKSAVRQSGGDQLPAWPLLRKLKTAKKGLHSVEEYLRAARFDGKLHSQVSFTTSTGRTSSSEPSLQNVPRDPRFRGLIKARPGYVILAADYSAIELRIAAALAERVVFNLRRLLRQGADDSWFLRRSNAGLNATSSLQCPPEPETWTVDWLNEAIPAVVQNVLLRKVQTMTSIFSRRLDPHLVTAIDMARRQGRLDFGQSPVEWLASKDSETQKELKFRLHDERQDAKTANFGLLYRMGAIGLHKYGIANYGLTWTAEEAAQARRAWFELTAVR
ncbi:MAG: DNA polymerase [Acidobacteriaceae bacterium]